MADQRQFKDLDLLAVGNTIQLIGAIWKGDDQMLLCMFPERHGDLYGASWVDNKDEIQTPIRALNMTSDEWALFLRQTDLLETNVLAKAADGKVTKAVIRKGSRTIAQTISWEVYHRDGFKCRYCGSGPGIPLTTDHLILWEEGGPSIPGNLLSACKKCNGVRGNKPYAEWLSHPYYRKVSRSLSDAVKQANLDLVATLDSIPVNLHKPSKRK